MGIERKWMMTTGCQLPSRPRQRLQAECAASADMKSSVKSPMHIQNCPSFAENELQWARRHLLGSRWRPYDHQNVFFLKLAKVVGLPRQLRPSCACHGHPGRFQIRIGTAGMGEDVFGRGSHFNLAFFSFMHRCSRGRKSVLPLIQHLAQSRTHHFWHAIGSYSLTIVTPKFEKLRGR